MRFYVAFALTFLLVSCSGLKKQSHTQAFGGGFPENKVTHNVVVNAPREATSAEKITSEHPKRKVLFSKQAETQSHKSFSAKSLTPKLYFENRPFAKYADSTIKNTPPDKLPVETNSLLGFIFALSGLLLLPLVGNVAGLVLGIVGLNIYNKNPEKYNSTSKGFAKAAIIISAIMLFLVLIYIALVLAIYLTF